MRHEWFFQSFWLLTVVGMWYFGTHLNQLWHADAYMPGYLFTSIPLAIFGIIVVANWVDLYQAEPSLFGSINGSFTRTFYWRDWMFDDGHDPQHNFVWDDFLTIAVAACASFFFGHFAGPLRDGVDFFWFFWVALALAGYLPTWIRRQNINRWRDHIKASEAPEQSPETYEPPSPPPGGARDKSVRKSTSSSSHSSDGKVVKLRPGSDEKSKLSA